MAQTVKIFGTVTITTAGTRQRVTTSDISMYSVLIQADPGNTGNVYVGDITVTSLNGEVLAPGDSYIVDLDPEIELKLADFYVDAATSGNKVRVQYLTTRGA